MGKVNSERAIERESTVKKKVEVVVFLIPSPCPVLCAMTDEIFFLVCWLVGSLVGLVRIYPTMYVCM